MTGFTDQPTPPYTPLTSHPVAKGAVLIPAYREENRIGSVVRSAKRHIPLVVVVDDGSPDNTLHAAQDAGAVVLVHRVNQGKGSALRTGFCYAREQGLEFVLTMDGDGQHSAEDIPAFLELFAQGTFQVLVGNRMQDPKAMPITRRIANRVMSTVLSRKMGQRVPDSQNGFRLYRTDMIPQLPETDNRFAAESEILLMLARLNVIIGSVPVRCIYGNEKSKINPFRDTFRFFRMLKAFDQRISAEKKRLLEHKERT